MEKFRVAHSLPPLPIFSLSLSLSLALRSPIDATVECTINYGEYCSSEEQRGLLARRKITVNYWETAGDRNSIVVANRRLLLRRTAQMRYCLSFLTVTIANSCRCYLPYRQFSMRSRQLIMNIENLSRRGEKEGGKMFERQSAVRGQAVKQIITPVTVRHVIIMAM